MVTIFIAAVAVTIISGPVIDISKKYILAQFLCLISGASASLLMSGATSTLILATAAVFIGICVSGWHTPSIPYLSLLYNKNRGLALSLHTVGASLGDGIAPPIAGPNYAGPVVATNFALIGYTGCHHGLFMF